MVRSPTLLVSFFLAVLMSGAVRAEPAAGIWQLVPSPNAGPQPEGNTLWGVAAVTANDVWAVGAQPNQSQYLTAPLAIHWNGMQWDVAAIPTVPALNVSLRGVAAAARDDVWAVGSSDAMDCGLCARTLIEHWDGRVWTIVPSPNPGWANLLNSVSVGSASDIWAVGYQWVDWSTWIPLILHYDGLSWSALDASQYAFGQLEAVFTVGPSDAWAVGWIGTTGGPGGIQAFALHWNGASWTRVDFPTESGGYILLRGISGAAPNDLWAVGVYKYVNGWGLNESLARTYHWDGSAWTPVLPGVFGRDSRMYDVHAVGSNDVWAVGGEPGPPGSEVAFRYVTVHWDGVSWSNVENPNQGVLYAVTASSSANAWAVGAGFGDHPGTHTLRYTLSCGSADFDCDEDVGTDADIAAFFACLAGACPEAPCSSVADFNGDGDAATDADIEAFFRVLAGGSC